MLRTLSSRIDDGKFVEFLRRAKPAEWREREAGPFRQPSQPRRASSPCCHYSVSGPGYNGPLTLSIVIPAYNEERRLPATLDVILAVAGHYSPYRDAEVLVVDDGSTDATAAVVESRAAREPRLAAGAAIREIAARVTQSAMEC